MPDIASIANGSVGPIHKAAAVGRSNEMKSTGNVPAADAQVRSDRVEVSEFASWLQTIRQMPSTRAEKVDAVRAAIDAGSYETPEKYEQAIDGLLEDLQS